MRPKYRIQQQLTLFIALLILLFGSVIVATLTLYTMRQDRVIKEHTISSSISLLESILEETEYILTKSIASLSKSPELSAYLAASEEQKDVLRPVIKEMLNDCRISSQYIEAFCLYLPDSHEIITSYDNLTLLRVTDPSRVQWLEVPILPLVNRSNWTIVSGILNSIGDSGASYMMIQKAAFWIGTGAVAQNVQLCICLPQSLIRSHVFPYTQSSGLIAMQDQQGHLFTHTNVTIPEYRALSERLIKLSSMKQNDFGYTVTLGADWDTISWRTSPLTGWTIYIITPFSFLIPILLSVLLPAVLAITPTFFIIQRFCRHLWEPIVILRNHLKSVEEGNLHAYAPTKFQNEFGELFLGYNSMLARINELIQELSDTRAYHLDAEVRNLQSQINPHFLYNTLDTIQWMCNFGESEKAASMTRKLAHFYRISLNDGKPMISVEKTVEMIESYFDIYRDRNGNRHHMTITAESSLLHTQMLHNVVQPLVENAISHGLSNVAAGGELHVYIRDAGDGMMEISVQDNGEGIEPDNLHALREAIATRTRKDGWAFALTNINQRLIMVYGPDCALKIESSQGKGTLVLLQMKL